MSFFLRAILGRIMPASQFGRGFATLVGGTAGAQLIGLIAIPIATRLFGSEAFGVLAIYVSLLMLVQPAVGLKYELAIPLLVDERVAIATLLLSLGIVALTVGIIAACLLAFPDIGDMFASVAQLGNLKWALPVGILLAAGYESFRLWAIRQRSYGVIAGTAMAQSVGRSTVQLASGFAGAGALGLVGAEIVGKGLGIARLARSALPAYRRHSPSLSIKDLLAAAKNEWTFPALQAPAALLNSAGLQVPTLLLATLYGPRVAGWYYIGQRVMGIPVGLIGDAMAQVFLGEVSSLAATDPSRIKSMFTRLSRKLFLVALPPALAVALFGPWLAQTVLGGEWVYAGSYLRFLSVAFLFKLGLDGLINLAIIRRNDLSLAWALLRLTIVSGALYGAHALGWGHESAVACLAGAFAVSYVVKWVFWRRALDKLIAEKHPASIGVAN